MNVTELLIAEMKHEAVVTKKLLQLVPMEKAEWQPHGKSSQLGKLAKHIAETPGWTNFIVLQNEYDLTSGLKKPANATTADELVMVLEENCKSALDILANTTDDALSQPWTLRHGEHVVFTMPKIVALRNMVFNHIVHHRAQLGVFLRLLDIPIPGTYGPSADAP